MISKSDALAYAAVAVFVAFCLALPSAPEGGETVDVQDRGEVFLSFFDCQYISRSSLIERVCYAPKASYLLIEIAGTYYQYCGIGSGTIAEFLAAPSMGKFFNKWIKDNYDCRGDPPDYTDY